MPGYVVNKATQIQCIHGGVAQATPVPNVKIMQQPVIVQPPPETVAGCPFTTGGSPQPCVTASIVMASTRVKVYGQAVLLVDSQAVCAPNGTGLRFIDMQGRVKAQ